MRDYVRLGTLDWLGWLGLALWLGAAGSAFADGETGPALGFVVLSVLPVYLLAAAYVRYAVDDVALYAVTPIGWHYRMAWTEVQYAEVGSRGTLVFHGVDKRFVLPSVGLWSGAHTRATLGRLLQQMRRRKIVPVPSNTADYRWKKNVRVSGN